jgi:hypothetical protein
MRRAAVEAILCVTFLFFSPGVSASASESVPAAAENVKLVGHLDIEGGGMVDVHEGIAYIGHVKPPLATTILDVSDPANPKILSRIEAKPHTHSHKARACGGVMLSNRELYAGSVPGYIFNSLFRRSLEIGLAVTDVSDPANPREIALLPASGIGIANAPAGVHRFQFDCERELAYVSATLEGYRGNIALIVDLADPASPKEIGRWWAEGQWIAGGEKPSWSRNAHRVHHPNRLGDRLYLPMWHGGFAIADISDTANPKTVVYVDHRQPSPTHTALPIGHEIMGRRWLLVFDEDVSDECEDPPASMWLYDISDEAHPELTSSFRVPEGGKYSRCDGEKGKRFGAHQPHEYVGKDNLVYAAWFAGGLRIIDISDPWKPVEVGHYVPEPAEGFDFPQSNDVFVDGRGLIYLIDRHNGLDVLEFSAGAGEG